MTFTRKQIQVAYIRVCKDSNFTIEWHAAMGLVSSLLHLHPIDIWAAMGSIDVMENIAKGEHPILEKEKYNEVFADVTF